MDLIDREQAIDLADAMWEATHDKNIHELWSKLKDLPPAEKTGKWLKAQYPFEQCSVCGAYFDTSSNQANYCCVCGARMEKG